MVIFLLSCFFSIAYDTVEVENELLLGHGSEWRWMNGD